MGCKEDFHWIKIIISSMDASILSPTNSNSDFRPEIDLNWFFSNHLLCTHFEILPIVFQSIPSPIHVDQFQETGISVSIMASKKESKLQLC